MVHNNKLTKYFRRAVLLGITFVTLLTTGCKRDTITQDTGANIRADKLTTPGKFDFAVEKSIKIHVRTDMQTKVDVYIGTVSPDKLAASRITSDACIIEILVPKWVDDIAINTTKLDGTVESFTTQATSSVIDLYKDNKKITRKSSSGLSCGSLCTSTTNNSTGNVTVSAGTVKCLTGTISGSITVDNGATAMVCASGTLSGITVNGTGKLYLLDSAVLTVSNLNFNGNNTQFYNWGKLYTSGSITLKGTVESHNLLSVGGSLTVSNNTTFDNYGTLTTSSNMDVSGTFTTYGHVSVSSDFNNNDNCFLYCETVCGKFNNSGQLSVNSLLKCVNDFTQNGNGNTQLGGGLILTKNFTASKDFTATGSKMSAIKVSSVTTLNNNSKFYGFLNICDSNGIETNNGTINSPAAVSCSGYIPKDACNTVGFGTIQIQDADNDGVADAFDEFPNDPTRAYTDYYPCKGMCSTIAMEDLWPAKGDYDFNDQVVAFNVKRTLNASGKVVEVRVKVRTLAVGASFTNGFGFAFDGLPSTVAQSATGHKITGTVFNLSNGIEQGQTDVVCIAYDDPKTLYHQSSTGSMYNTVRGGGSGYFDSVSVLVKFVQPVADSSAAFTKFNPFFVINSTTGRGKEIHLTNRKPTSLANTALLGTSYDLSNPGINRYYIGINGLPWVIQLPENFKYPLEKSPITTAYNYFDDWVLSNGTQYPNWYRQFPSYVNLDYIY